MKKLTFGSPEVLTPSYLCSTFLYKETPTAYDYSKISFRENARGCVLTLPLLPDEQIYGFGLQLKGFNFRGRKVTLRPNADPVAMTGDSHAPVPFFISTAGYGIYVDTARHAEFYCGIAKSGAKFTDAVLSTSTSELYASRAAAGNQVIEIQIPAAKGVDVYVMDGSTITDVVAQYNMLAGGGCCVPDWGLGVYYRCYSKYPQSKILSMADYFRKSDIPCSVLGLEPGWQTHAYSCTYVWDKERYPDPSAMIDALGEKGYHLNLWEHAFTHPDSPIYDKISAGCGEYDVWGGHVPDFALPEIRATFASYHRDSIIKGCLDGFKLDECDGSDYTGSWTYPNSARFPSGMDGEQYHSMFGTLYMRTILEALGDTPTFSEVRNAGALCSPYPFALYSDLYDHRDFIRGCATCGFGGLLWAPEVRHAESKADLIRRAQTAVFSPHCLINAWYCEEAPWIALGAEDDIRSILREREAITPLLRTAFDLYRMTGKAPVRALVSDYTSDRETYGIDDQYMLGENLLIAPMTAKQDSRRVYLPEGEWRDYFTGKKADCGWSEVSTPNIPVYVRE